MLNTMDFAPLYRTWPATTPQLRTKTIEAIMLCAEKAANAGVGNQHMTPSKAKNAKIHYWLFAGSKYSSCRIFSPAHCPEGLDYPWQRRCGHIWLQYMQRLQGPKLEKPTGPDAAKKINALLEKVILCKRTNALCGKHFEFFCCWF